MKQRFVSREWQKKLILSLACLIGYFWHIGFYAGCPWQNHLLYSFCHANIFHLTINLVVLWGIKNKIPIVKPLIVSVAASLLPMYISTSTMGLSGFLFAAFGIMWGKTGRWTEAFKRVMPFVLLTMVIPNTNGLLHFYAFSIGFIVQYIITEATARHE